MTHSKTALITGASAGLGVTFADRLAALGYNLVLVARRREKLSAVAEDMETRHKVQTHILEADLSEPQAPEAIYAALADLNISIDYLVNNAGSAGPDLFEERDWSEQQKFFELMMTSVAHMCHLFVPAMIEKDFGRIINVASVAGRIPRPSGCNYGPSKAYVIALTEELAVSLKGTGVNATALCPGFTHTDFHEVAELMEMKNNMPSWMWYPAEVVVDDGIKAVEKGKPIKISGRLYRWLDPFFQSVWTRPLVRVRGRE